MPPDICSILASLPITPDRVYIACDGSFHVDYIHSMFGGVGRSLADTVTRGRNRGALLAGVGGLLARADDVQRRLLLAPRIPGCGPARGIGAPVRDEARMLSSGLDRLVGMLQCFLVTYSDCPVTRASISEYIQAARTIAYRLEPLYHLAPLPIPTAMFQWPLPHEP